MRSACLAAVARGTLSAMRAALLAAFTALALVAAAPARAEAPPQPLGKWAPPEGRFFDDPIAVSPDGKNVVAIATDAATVSRLELLTPGQTAAATLEGLPVGVTALAFLAADRILVVSKKEGETRVSAQVVQVKSTKDVRSLVLDKARIGPADAIEVVDHDGRRLVVAYTRGGKKNIEHTVQVYAAEGLKLIAKRVLSETVEGAMRTKAGEVRPLWWSRGHTYLSAQKIGDYDKARDMRRPDRFVRLDLVNDKIIDEHEIDDALALAKVVLARKTGPAEEIYPRLSEDRRDILVLDRVDERALPLARQIIVYEPATLRYQSDEKTLYVGLQVDTNNLVAVGKRVQDPDDFDLYAVDRASIHGKELSSRRVFSLAGGQRPIGFAVGGGRVAILRKQRGFDRGGIRIELYALP